MTMTLYIKERQRNTVMYIYGEQTWPREDKNTVTHLDRKKTRRKEDRNTVMSKRGRATYFS